MPNEAEESFDKRTNGLESAARNTEKVRTLRPNEVRGNLDKSGAPYKAWEDFGYHLNRSLRKQM